MKYLAVLLSPLAISWHRLQNISCKGGRMRYVCLGLALPLGYRYHRHCVCIVVSFVCLGDMQGRFLGLTSNL
jgi:hypothetical protein